MGARSRPWPLLQDACEVAPHGMAQTILHICLGQSSVKLSAAVFAEATGEPHLAAAQALVDQVDRGGSASVREQVVGLFNSFALFPEDLSRQFPIKREDVFTEPQTW